jgi:hypothetical protein
VVNGYRIERKNVIIILLKNKKMAFPNLFRKATESPNKQEKVDPGAVIREALALMSKIEQRRDEVGKRRWENEFHKYGLTGDFEEIFEELKKAKSSPLIYAAANSGKVKDIIKGYNQIKEFLDSESGSYSK